MTTRDPDPERRGLQLSVAGALGMSALGIGFFFLTDSEAVLLDGLFSLIGFAVGLITLRVSAMIRRPGDEQFHFGYAAYEPMLNLVKGLLIAFISIFAAISAIDTITEGGREIQGGMIIAYAVTACAGCLAIALVQGRIARRSGSPLAKVDSVNWLIDGAISGAVALAFVVVVLLEGGSFDHLLPYADPAVVLLLVLVSLPMPIAIIRENWRQLLGRAPTGELQDLARKRVAEALEGVEGVTPKLSMLETGRNIYVQVYLLLDSDADLDSVEEQDALREKVYRTVSEGSPDVGLDVIFTREARWSRMSAGLKGSEAG